MDGLADFHFLRPAWLAALPAGAWFSWYVWQRLREGGSWRIACDPALLPHLTVGTAVALSIMPRWVPRFPGTKTVA